MTNYIDRILIDKYWNMDNDIINIITYINDDVYMCVQSYNY